MMARLLKLAVAVPKVVDESGHVLVLISFPSSPDEAVHQLFKAVAP